MVYNETIKPFGSLFMEIITHSERETEDAGAAFAAKIPDGAVVAMYGELGAGKTAFVRGMARGMWPRLPRQQPDLHHSQRIPGAAHACCISTCTAWAARTSSGI